MNEYKHMLNWLEEHKACTRGYKWARENAVSLSDLWRKLFVIAPDECKADWLVWLYTRPGVVGMYTNMRFWQHAMSLSPLLTKQGPVVQESLEAVEQYMRHQVVDREQLEKLRDRLHYYATDPCLNKCRMAAQQTMFHVLSFLRDGDDRHQELVQALWRLASVEVSDFAARKRFHRQYIDYLAEQPNPFKETEAPHGCL